MTCGRLLAVAPRVAADPGWWDRLWPLLVTAGLSLLILVVVQLYVVPHVESRKRRDDRWEEDVRQLGELVAFDLTEAGSDYASMVIRSLFVADLEADPDVDQDRYRDLKRTTDDERRAAREGYRKALVQVRWVADRVCSAQSHDPDLRRLKLSVMGVEVNDLTNVDPTYRDGADLDRDKVDKAHTGQREAIADLLKRVSVLASRRRPRRDTRMSRAVSSFRRRLSGKA